MPQLAESWNYYTKRKKCAGCKAQVSLKYGVCSACYRRAYGKEFQAIRTRGDKKQEFFGVELEIQGPQQYEHIQKLSELEIPANFSFDGGGVEVQFFPFGFKFFDRNRDKFNTYFTWLKNKSAYWTPTSTGIHIHISRGSFRNDLHLFRFMKLIYLNAEQMRKLAKRNSSWGHYDPSVTYRERYYDGRFQCDRSSSSKLEDRLKDRATAWYNHKGNNDYSELGQKRDAVNICHTHTIEIRIFRSTSDCSLFMSYIQLCKALVEYSRSRDDWTGFCRYVMGNKKTFPDLTSQMQKLGFLTKEKK